MGDGDDPDERARVHWSVPPPPPGSEIEAPAEALGEEFLYHLYRGSELLQDDQFYEAKSELERAMSLQPKDVEGQSLLGIVYFRLGHYPRAIQIYEELVRVRPAELAPRVNLALCHLKTGQLPQARSLLEEIVQNRPDHTRAWGYLGLAYQRLGDADKASIAFDRAGRPALAARVRAAASIPPEPPDPIDDAPMTSPAAGVQEIAQRLARAAPSVPPPPSEAPEPPLPSRRPSGGWIVPGTRVSVPQPLRRAAEDALLVFPERPRVVLHVDGAVLARVDGAFHARTDCIRAVLQDGAAAFRSIPLPRQGRSLAAAEPLGGMATPFATFEGEGRLALGAPEPFAPHVSALDGDPFYIKEDRLLAFDHSVRHEVGRLPLADGEFAHLVQLTGTGFVVYASRGPLHGVEIVADRPARIRSHRLVGWIGRMIARPAGTDDTHAPARGIIVISGSGIVLMDGG
jgi:uncharacterized protein (AIM24 family)